MINKKIIAKLIGNTEKTISNWEKEERPIILFLNQFFREDQIEEWLNTGKIHDFNPKREKEKTKIEEHVFFHAIQKINNIPELFILGKKEFWLKGFINAIKNCEKESKNELIKQIEKTENKKWQPEKWKHLTKKWVMENLSEFECELIINYKNETLNKIN